MTFNFIIAILATYLITIMLVETAGPFEVFYKLRNSRFMKYYGLLNCTVCTSTNVALFTALYVTTNPIDWFMTFLAIAGAVTVLDKWMEL